jgi:hypothetical protein
MERPVNSHPVSSKRLVDLPRRKALRLSVVPLQDARFGSGELFGKKPQDKQRVLGPACVNHRGPPHWGLSQFTVEDLDGNRFYFHHD